MTAPDPQSRSSRIAFAALLGALATLGPFAVDTYLPAFAGMQAALGATPLEMQQTLSAYLVAFGVMFLFHGAISDSFGRKPVSWSRSPSSPSPPWAPRSPATSTR